MTRQTSGSTLPKVGGKKPGTRQALGGNPCQGGNKRGGVVGQKIHKFKKTSSRPDPQRAFGNVWGQGVGVGINRSAARSAGAGGFSAH